jgi:hypothetical protein
MTAYQGQIRAAQRADEIQQVAASLTAMLSVHKHEFPVVTAPIATPPPPIGDKDIEDRCLRDALSGLHWWQRAKRRDAKERGQQQAMAQIRQRQEALEAERANHQRALDEEWQRLLANDPDVVLHTLDEAFEDNQAPAVAVDCEGDRVTVVMTMEEEDQVPDRKPAVTPTGQATLRKLSKSDRSDIYRGWVYSNILATVRETFAVVPKVNGATVVVLRKEPVTPYGEHPLSAIYAGTLTRAQCDRIAWNSPAAVNAVLDADDLLIQASGAAKSLVPIDLSTRADLANLVTEFERTLASTG